LNPEIRKRKESGEVEIKKESELENFQNIHL